MVPIRPPLSLLGLLTLAFLLLVGVLLWYHRPFITQPRLGPPSSTKEHLVVVFPHFHREVFALSLAAALCEYLPRAHPHATFEVIGVQQLDEPPSGLYSKGLSWNVALAWLAGRSPDQAVLLQDVDAVPRANVDYACPGTGHVVVWWLTTGGVKGRLGDFRHVNGYPIHERGWGQEDRAFWARLQRAGVELHLWPDEVEPATPPVVLNLEWGEASEEAGLREHYWGHDWSRRVLVVAQGNPTYGLEPRVPIPAKSSWYTPERHTLNRHFGEIVDALEDDLYEAYLAADGLSQVDAQTAHPTDFFAELPLDPAGRVTLVNLGFEAAKVYGHTPRFLADHPAFGWYLRPATSCDGGCISGLVCDDGVCLPDTKSPWPVSG